MRHIVFGLLVLASACSSKSSSTPPADAGSDADTTVDGAPLTGPRVNDHGVVIDFDTKKALAGVKVHEGDVATTTDATGAFSLSVQANTPLDLIMEADGHTTLQWPQILLSADYDRGKVTTVSLSTFHLVGGSLDGYDNSLGVLYVAIHAAASCAAGQTGATMKVLSAPNAVVRYFNHAVPSKSQTSIAPKEDPAVAIYNLPTNVPVQLELDHPTCTAAPFPHTDGAVTYTGNITTVGGDANSYAVFFLE